MHRMKTLVIASVALLASISAASACSCIQRPEAEQIARNDIALQGKVIAVKRTTRLGRKIWVARVQVLSVEKGTSRQYINVEAFDYAGQCGVVFKMNEPLRFAAMKRGTRYRTNICRIFPTKV